MTTGQIGRAELARVIAQAGGTEAADLIADVLGFEAPDRTPDGRTVGGGSDLPTGGKPEPQPSSQEAPRSAPAEMWHVARSVDLVVDADERPEQSEKPAPRSGGTLVTNRTPEPLCTWSRFWPRLHRLIGVAIASRALDVARLVPHLARGERPRRLPRRARPRWPHDLEVWVDRADRLIPLWADQDRVVAALRRHVGRRMPVRILQAGAVLERQCEARLGAAVLVLGDLGAFADEDTRQTWVQAGRRLRAQGRCALALTPHPDPTHGWRCVSWTPQAQEESGERLLDLVSAAELVQPGLLRAVRERFTDLGVVGELRAWNHEDVEVRLRAGMALTVEAMKARQAGLARMKIDHAALARRIDDWHANMLTEVRHVQTLAWVARGVGAPPPGDLDEARRWVRSLGARSAASACPEKWRSFFRSLEARLPAQIIDDPTIGRLLKQYFDEGQGEGRTETRDVPVVWRERTFVTAGRLAIGHLPTALGTWWIDHQRRPIAGPVDLRDRQRVQVQTELRRLTLERLTQPSWAIAMGIHRRRAWAEADTPDGPLRLFWDPTAEAPTWRADDRRATVDAFGVYEDLTLAGVEVRFRLIPAGTFLMGSPENEEGRWKDEGPHHKVALTRPYWLADAPVTQMLWEAVTREKPSRFKSVDQPVEQVSWDDAVGFIKRLDSDGAIGLMLPTEAQWEYACRAGTTTARYGELNDVAWYVANSGQQTHPARQKQPNPWGLYDMLGNVWEWCSDYWKDSYESAGQLDPKGPSEGAGRVVRGGSWYNTAGGVRAASRSWDRPGYRIGHLGFRLARGPAPSARSAKSGGAVRGGAPKKIEETPRSGAEGPRGSGGAAVAERAAGGRRATKAEQAERLRDFEDES